MEFKTVTSCYSDQFSERVNQALKDGWITRQYGTYGNNNTDLIAFMERPAPLDP